jgi:hypothetical protein
MNLLPENAMDYDGNEQIEYDDDGRKRELPFGEATSDRKSKRVAVEVGAKSRSGSVTGRWEVDVPDSGGELWEPVGEWPALGMDVVDADWMDWDCHDGSSGHSEPPGPESQASHPSIVPAEGFFRREGKLVDRLHGPISSSMIFQLGLMSRSDPECYRS